MRGFALRLKLLTCFGFFGVSQEGIWAAVGFAKSFGCARRV